MNTIPESSHPVLRPRILARVAFVLACIATLVTLFYVEENWRGKRAWQKQRQALESEGISLNWDDFIPPKVPDDQNAFKAPKMQEWFVRSQPGAPAKSPGNTPWSQTGWTNSSAALHPNATNVVIARITILDRAHPGPEAPGVRLKIDDPLAPAAARKLFDQAMGPSLQGAQGSMILISRPFESISPIDIVLETDRPVAVSNLTAFLAAPDKNSPPAWHPFRILSSGTNAFQIVLQNSTCLAADYLAWSDPMEADFDLMRDALKRPYARMEGDYTQPLLCPIPDFVGLRQVCQILSQRAQCNLLLGKPAEAFHDLSLVRQLCTLLEAKPSGKPITLVDAMIHVAITGLYTAIVSDGLELKAWQEPQLIALSQQLDQVDLPSQVAAAFRCEEAFSCQHFAISSRSERANLVAFGTKQPNFYERLTSPRFIFVWLAPTGWIHQNMAAFAFVDQQWIQALQLTNQVLDPGPVDTLGKEFERKFGTFSPFTCLASIAIPNFQKASQVLAKNQTLANLALIACALERQRLAVGQYPEALDTLSPRFLEKIPHDLILGKPLKYRAENGNYALYSIGWNGVDDGGTRGKSLTDGDWVWANRH